MDGGFMDRERVEPELNGPLLKLIIELMEL